MKYDQDSEILKSLERIELCLNSLDKKGRIIIWLIVGGVVFSILLGMIMGFPEYP